MNHAERYHKEIYQSYISRIALSLIPLGREKSLGLKTEPCGTLLDSLKLLVIYLTLMSLF